MTTWDERGNIINLHSPDPYKLMYFQISLGTRHLKNDVWGFPSVRILAPLKEAIPSNLLLHSANAAMSEENSKQFKSKQSISTDARKKIFQFLMQV